MTETELIDYLQLNFSPGIGPATFLKLVSDKPCASSILNSTDRELRSISGIGEKLIQVIRNSQRLRHQLKGEIEFCRQHGIQILLYHDDEYPELLKQIPSPPPVLFCEGNFQSLQKLEFSGFAMVGTRHPTLYGKRVAHKLASKLSRRGFTIISGLARGIDRVVHEAALSEYRPTIAVLGSGLQHVYPSSHQELAKEIVKDGLLLSEVLPSSPPHSRLFPRRNRIISGLSVGTLVLEAATRSGALITARHAIEQNREVMAVPGMIDTAVAGGCNKLIKDGAQLVESIEDILEALPNYFGSTAPITLATEPQLSATEKLVFELIPNTPTLIDLLVIPDQLTTGKLLSTLTTLEFKNLITRPTSNSVAKTGVI